MNPMRIAVALAVLAVAAIMVVVPGSSGTTRAEAERVLVVSIPTLTWDRVADEQPPNLVGLLEEAAVASASVRTIGIKTDLGEGYATMGAGNRSAVPTDVASLAFPPDAEYEGEPVAEVYERRFGTPVGDAEVLHIGAAAIQHRNDALLYGSEVGALGAALAREGRSAAVVANGDLTPAPPVGELQRQAALMVMDDLGRVDRGVVDGSLLDLDADLPSGLALDRDAVIAAARDAWDGSDVVLVELSDLVRAEAAESVVTPEVAEAAEADALDRTDAILGDLLELVDLDRDLVVLVSPVAPAGPDQLVVAALAGAGIDPGLARSGTSRRDGYVTLPDLGPTVLDALGIDKPDVMNGAPIASAGGGSPDAATFRSLADDNVRALFRNDLSGPLTVLFIVSQILTYGLAAYALSNRRRRWCRTSAFLLLAGMAIPFVSFLAGVAPYWQLGVVPAIAAICLVAALLAVGIQWLVRRLPGERERSVHARALIPPVVITAATVVLLVGDIVLGGPLQIDTAFGYGGGAIVAGRLAGYGNLAWALMVAALIIAVTGVWGRRELGRRLVAGSADHRFAMAVVAGVFVLAVLAVGLPALGANVGGTISVVSGLSITMLVLAGVRIDLRRLVAVGFLTVLVLAVFGAIDLTRDPQDQTHLGRLIDQTLGDEGFTGFGTVLERKINANLRILFSSVWSLVIPAALAFLAFLIWRPPRFLRTLFHHVPGMRACVVGVLATGVIGGIVNDSGIAIPAIMLTLLLPHVAFLIVETHLASEPEPVGDQT
jgi:hypothetical protein